MKLLLLFLICSIIIIQPVLAYEMNVTIAKKGVVGKNIFFDDIRTVLGTNGELFVIDKIGYFIIDINKTYTFSCYDWQSSPDSCVIDREERKKNEM